MDKFYKYSLVVPQDSDIMNIILERKIHMEEDIHL